MHNTTADFIAANDWMEVACNGCRRLVWLHPDRIAKTFPRSMTIAQAETRMRCKCGHRGASIGIRPPQRYDVQFDPKNVRDWDSPPPPPPPDHE